jgi:1,4-alpha-glucan branching enzyme
MWLERVLRALPEAGVQVGTLSDAVAGGFVGAAVELPPSSWGSGKDWQVWAGDKVADLVQLNTEVVDSALSTIDKALDQTASLAGPIPRDRIADQILRETLLTVSSDWPFMVTKDSAADYARYRARIHAHAAREIAGALASGRRDTAQRLADGWNQADGLFGALDARRLPR